MATRNELKFPIFKAVHPKEILSEELKERKINQKDFAQSLGLQPSHFNELLKGKRPLSASIADKIETVLGISAVELLNIQNQYSYDLRHSSQIVAEAEEAKYAAI